MGLSRKAMIRLEFNSEFVCFFIAYCVVINDLVFFLQKCYRTSCNVLQKNVCTKYTQAGVMILTIEIR